MLPAQLEPVANISTISSRLIIDFLLFMSANVFTFSLMNGRAEIARERKTLSRISANIILRSIDLTILTARTNSEDNRRVPLTNVERKYSLNTLRDTKQRLGMTMDSECISYL